MPKVSKDNQPALREFIKEYGKPVYIFCDYMLPKDAKVDAVVVEIFAEFGEVFRKKHRKETAGWENLEMRVKLFSIAWKHIRQAMQEFHFMWTPGRDTRAGRRADENLLSESAGKNGDGAALDAELVARLKFLDPEFRAPLVLKDIVRLEEEEILRVLELRWGVYRHRLHRGRIEYKDGLKGPVIPPATKGSQPTL